ncbi:cytochrome c peroxidase [Gaertneriomyces semiglobifer]|nr:cytochrome c peroxidase [Gaertneriomyces semiglobifer]
MATGANHVAIDYRAVAQRISNLLPDENVPKDHHWGPSFVRLAWHSSATYSAADNSGGSNGAYMRLEFKTNDPLHGGLDLARTRLEPVKTEFPAITYADLYTFCGIVAIKEMGGPAIPWRPGRKDIDVKNLKVVEQAGRFPLPDDTKETVHEKFKRMGLTRQDMVALMGGHVLGRCHVERSGYDGQWVDDPIKFSNEFYEELLEDDWKPAVVEGSGKQQFEAYPEGEKLMMLPTDMQLLEDEDTRRLCQLYKEDQERWFKDFSDAFVKLLEGGVHFDESVETVVL